MPKSCIAACGNVLFTGLAALVLLGQVAFAQDDSTVRARDLKNSAFELYKQGDYEAAAAFFSKVQARQNELTALERQDLRKLVDRNSTALRSRREGSIQIRQATEAIQKEKLEDANRFLKLATTNSQYLSRADAVALDNLLEQMRAANRTTSPVAASRDAPKVDYSVLMTQAREALKKGELDRADQLAAQAEKAYAGPPTWMQPWSDNPGKVHREVQTARQSRVKVPEPETQSHSPLGMVRRLWTRDDEAADKKVEKAPQPKPVGKENEPAVQSTQKEDDSAFPNIRNLIWPAKKPEANVKEKTPDATRTGGMSPAALASQSGKEPKLPTTPKSGKSADLDTQFRDLASLPKPGAVQVDFDPTLPPPVPVANDVKPATLTANKLPLADIGKNPSAPGLIDGPSLPPPPTELDRPTSGLDGPLLPPPPEEPPVPKQVAPAAPKQPATTNPPASPTKQTPKVQPPSKRSTGEPPIAGGNLPRTKQVPIDLEKKTLEVARALIKQGYIALKNSDLEMARKLALEAKSLRPNLNWDEPNPDRLLTEIRTSEQRGTTTAAKLPEKPAAAPRVEEKRADARDLMRRGRVALGQNRLEEALQFCQQADASKHRWGLWEDSPARLHSDIQTAVKRRDRATADKKLAEARKLFADKKYPEAKATAWEAQKLYGPPSYWDIRRDTPDYLLTQIESAERAIRPANLPPPPDLLPTTQIAKLANSKPSATQVLKDEALALLAQAKELETQGKLIEAREKIMQASSLQASFGPNENSPSTALIQLAARCDAKVNQLLRDAEATANSNDPNRIQSAARKLADARSLNQVFGLDGKRIDDKSQWLNQVAQTKPVQEAPKTQDPPPVDPRLAEAQRKREMGLDKMARAREELRAGNTQQSLRLFEEALVLGVPEAANGIRSVQIEEYNQKKLSAHRNAEAALDAIKRKQPDIFRKIVAGIDLKLLSPEMARLVRESSAMPEMQPGFAQKDVARVDQPPGPPQFGGEGKFGITDEPVAQSDVIDQFRALQEVRFQKMRERSLNAQRHAMELFQSKNVDKAVNVLEQHINELAMSQLSDDQVVLLRRQVESRLQQFKTVQAQITMVKAQREFPTLQHDEGARNAKIAGLQQQIVDLMDQYRGLYKERKFKEAWVLAEKMRDLDPENPAVTAAVHQAKYSHRYAEQAKYSAEDEEFIYKNGQPGRWGPAGLSFENPMVFDEEVMKRIQNRKPLDGSAPRSKSEQELAIEQQLQTPVSVDFQNTPLKQVIDDLHRMSGVNIVPEYKTLRESGISLEQPLQLKVEHVSLKSVLNMLLRQADLTFVVKDGVLSITTEKDAEGKLVQRTYSVADLVVPVEDYPLPSVFSYEDYMKRHVAGQTGQMMPTPYMDPYSMQNGQPIGSGSMGQMAPGQMGPNGQGMRQGGGGWQNQKGSRMPSNTIEEQLISLVTSSVAPSTWDSVGGQGHIQYYPLGMALVVNQVQDVQEQVFDLLNALRRLQDLQVAIEMRLVSVSESFFEMMGMDFDLKFLTHTRKWEPQLLTGQFQQPGYIQDFTPSNFLAGLTPAQTFTPDLDLPLNNTSFGNSFPTFGGYPGLGNAGGIDIGLAFLSDIQVFMFLEAAQGDRRMNVMQAPKVTVFNGQTATIAVQDLLFFLTGMNPVQTPQGPIFVAQHSAMPIGTGMTVTPVVSADRRFVRMNVNMSMSSLLSATVPVLPVQIALPSIFINGSGATPEPNRVVQMFFQQPGSSQITVNTTVNVPDGGTVLLGGLKFMAEARNESGPPVISKIPYLNRLFKNVGWGREGATLMLLVSPRIIINEEEEMIFRGELQPIPRP